MKKIDLCIYSYIGNNKDVTNLCESPGPNAFNHRAS